MSDSLRWSEAWFRRGLWLVAFIFAWFLIGLGSLLIDRLPGSHTRLSPNDYLSQPAVLAAQLQMKTAQQQLASLDIPLQNAMLHANATRIAYNNERQTFNNWLDTRKTTGQAVSDKELLERTHHLDTLMVAQQQQQNIVEKIQQQQLQARSLLQQAEARYIELNQKAQQQINQLAQKLAYKAFLLRFILTVPLLLVAGWLFVKQRKKKYWPFVWGYIFFAVFTFFIEIVPYLPDVGLYMRYIIGIIATLLIGRYAIHAMQRYLEAQRQAEKMSEVERRKTLDYEVVQNRLAKQVCPGCERPALLVDVDYNFCIHCGLCLFDHCQQCHTRKSAFNHFCHQCGIENQQPV